MAWFPRTTFEHGLDGWRPVNVAQSVKAELVTDGTARSGASFLRCRTSVTNGSVAADFDTSLTMQGLGDGGGPGGNSGPIALTMFFPAISVVAWIRARPSGGQVSGALTIWELFLPNNNNHPNFNFSVGSDWTQISLSSRLLGGVSPRRARVEFYVGTTNTDLDIDCVSVT
jgi:hypothetical protein